MDVIKPDLSRSTQQDTGLREVKSLTLESVWAVLENERWESKKSLAEGSGVDADNLNRVVDFLVRWHFVDVEGSPEFLVRRKPEAISPLLTLELLTTINEVFTTINGRKRIAQRVACRTCGGRRLSFRGHNEVECATCHEKQWYALDGDVLLSGGNEQSAQQPEQPNLLGQILTHLGVVHVEKHPRTTPTATPDT